MLSPGVLSSLNSVVEILRLYFCLDEISCVENPSPFVSTPKPIWDILAEKGYFYISLATFRRNEASLIAKVNGIDMLEEDNA